MRPVRRLALIVLCALAPAAPAHGAVFVAGSGQNPGVAIDGVGTAYVGWQIDTYGPNDAVQVCRLPPKAKRCESVTTVAFPGEGFNRSRVSLIASGASTVDAIVPRSNGADYSTYLARSADGGRTFGPAIKISDGSFEQGVAGPNGTVALTGGVGMHVGVVAPDGSGAATRGSDLGGLLGGQWNDIVTAGGDVIAASSSSGGSAAWRLPPGADPNIPDNWQQLDELPVGRQPELAATAHGTTVLLEPEAPNAPGLVAQRLNGASWSKPVRVGASVLNNDFEMVSGGAGRLGALRTDQGRLYYATSTDGGTLWSSEVVAAGVGTGPWELEAAAGADGRGVAAVRVDTQIRVARFSPSQAPVASRRFGRGRVQVRSLCDGDVNVLVVEAKRDGARVAASRLLRRASFARARGAARLSRSKFRARYDLSRVRTRVAVRLVPRSGRSRAVRLAVRRCG
jgi:hypothetical protein